MRLRGIRLKRAGEDDCSTASPVDAPQKVGHGVHMSTVAEIEAVVPTLSVEELAELERFIHRTREGKVRGKAEVAGFDAWLAASSGIAKGKLTTDERMRETRGDV